MPNLRKAPLVDPPRERASETRAPSYTQARKARQCTRLRSDLFVDLSHPFHSPHSTIPHRPSSMHGRLWLDAFRGARAWELWSGQPGVARACSQKCWPNNSPARCVRGSTAERPIGVAAARCFKRFSTACGDPSVEWTKRVATGAARLPEPRRRKRSPMLLCWSTSPLAPASIARRVANDDQPRSMANLRPAGPPGRPGVDES